MVLLSVSLHTSKNNSLVLRSQINPHPGAALMQEEDISDDLNHDTLTSRSSDTIARARSQQTLVGCRQRFPDAS